MLRDGLNLEFPAQVLVSEGQVCLHGKCFDNHAHAVLLIADMTVLYYYWFFQIWNEIQ